MNSAIIASGKNAEEPNKPDERDSHVDDTRRHDHVFMALAILSPDDPG